MRSTRSAGATAFRLFNYGTLTLVALLCILPLVHIFAVSLSSAEAVNGNQVGLWPVDFSLGAYRASFDAPFLSALSVTMQRIVLGTAINMLVTFLMAYPLSKESDRFPYRNVYVWILVFTMLFSGGLIPTYILAKQLHLLNTMWVLVLPSAVNVFYIILLLNFFRQLPKEIEESALMDGASYFKSMYKIYLPLSKPVIATLLLFCIVTHWNAWFDGIMFINDTDKYPLQTYLQLLLQKSKSVLSLEDAKMAAEDAAKTSIYGAKMFLSLLPIIALYPFLQKYFTEGIVIGAVKG
ncbi:carbohydrate ABC transporter permease [Cohnella herbarum]|uniref:Carbohydrate ABC transporter permease n=1 Tax=Cohnella herbarum TaxID=2728023 RepID=A0A7Z2VPG4_9BACL|nr:carbohydrate ABC transporter permease [Cohnella herbarum]QJD86580.1 carbohydrate ABC transporter permease [Cohnella herbarum]